MLILLLLLLQADDLDTRLQRRPTVVMRLEQVPLGEAFQEITRQSGVAFRVDPSIAQEKVSLQLKKTGAFEAAQTLCRVHGGARLLFSTYAPTIVIAPSEPAQPPFCDTGPFHFQLSKILLSRSHSFDHRPECRLFLTLWTTWAPSGIPASLSAAVVTHARDDRETDLVLPEKGNEETTRLLGRPVIADGVTIRLAHPALGAQCIATLKGYREAVFIARTRPIRIEGIDKLPAGSRNGELSLLKLGRARKGLTAVLDGPTPNGPFPLPDHLQGLCFVDSTGQKYPVRISTSSRGTDRSRFEVICPKIPEEAVITACEASFVEAWATHRIPFEFQNIVLP